MLNIICYDLNGDPLRRFYQYDVGQKIVLNGLTLSPAPTVTLQCDTCSEPVSATVVVSGSSLIVTVPDTLLEDGLPLRGRIYQGGVTEEDIIGMIYIPVVPRVIPGPGGELPAPPDADGTYSLRAVVSSGAVTYTWVAET